MDTMGFPYNKTAFAVTSLLAASDEKDCWLTKIPSERLQALEFMRQMIYGLRLTDAQARYIGVPKEGSYKPEPYRY